LPKKQYYLIGNDSGSKEIIMAKTWFITGASKGFGRQWTEAALDRGDKVAATARDIHTLDSLVETYGDLVLPLELDVTDRTGGRDAVARTADHFGRLDVVVNNAGYGHFGMVEELSEDDVREQLETNLFGTLWITQAALPVMRAQKSGHIIQVTSEGGVTAFPGIGAYHASKWAVEGLSQSLAQEVASFGIKVTMVEPGPYGTDWLAVGARHSPKEPAYDGVREQISRSWDAGDLGDSRATRDAILAVADAGEPPLRIFFGKSQLDSVTRDYEARLATWNEWQAVSIKAFGGQGE
jgi:NAD(P)-dependent dehydrogenase (short-subunit alcohol dehydrogenase family)